MSIDLRIAAKKSFISKTEYVVVAVDDFEPAGEELYLVGKYATLEQAEAKAEIFRKKSSDPCYVYHPSKTTP
jgi:hypothetical protein